MIRLRHLAAGAAPLAALMLGACGAAAPASNDPTGLQTAPVEQRTLDVKVEASGTVQPPLIVDVKSKASGEVLKLYAETGDEVKQGKLLAEIDPRDVQNAYDQAKADLDVAQAQVQNATEQRKRAEALRQSNVMTAQDYESATLQEATAKSQLIRAQTNFQLATQKLNDVKISAPISGTVITKSVEEGTIIASASQNVSGGTTLFQLANTDTMEVQALVDETDIGRVQPGQQATVSVEAYPTRTFPGYVLKIEPQATVDQNVTMFPVIIRLSNAEKLLKTGMNADVQIQVAMRNNALVVPNDAVVSTQEANAVGAALGLSDQDMQQGLMGNVASAAQPAPAATDSAKAGSDTASAGQSAQAQKCQALIAKLRSGGQAGFRNMSDEDRATMRQCRSVFSAGRGGAGGGGFGGGFGGGAGGGQGARANRSGARPGVVFVADSTGKIEPRRVMLGVNDWDYTEVLSGVKAGENVVLASVARVQMQQNEMQNRIRERSGGMLKGNTPGGGRGGR